MVAGLVQRPAAREIGARSRAPRPGPRCRFYSLYMYLRGNPHPGPRQVTVSSLLEAPYLIEHLHIKRPDFFLVYNWSALLKHVYLSARQNWNTATPFSVLAEFGSSFFTCEPEILPGNWVSTMAADDLDPCVARSSASMKSTTYDICIVFVSWYTEILCTTLCRQTGQNEKCWELCDRLVFDCHHKGFQFPVPF